MSVCLRFFVVVTLLCSTVGTAIAQDKVNRVIQLRSSEATATADAKTQDGPIAQTSRVQRKETASRLPDPTKMKFDRIGEQSAKPAAAEEKPAARVASRVVPDLPAKQESTFDGGNAFQAQAVGQNQAPKAAPNTAATQPTKWQQPSVVTERAAFDLNRRPNQFSQNNNWGNNTQGAQIPKAAPITKTMIAPQINTRVVAPQFVNVKQITPLLIQMRNTSTSAARDLKLVATLPEHAEFVAARPKPTKVEGNQYEFIVRDLGPNSVRDIQIDVTPTEKRAIEIETQVWIPTQQKMSVSVREPNVQIRVNGNPTSNTGAQVKQIVTVENIGDGIAQDVRLNCELPKGWKLTNVQNQRYMPQLAPGQSTKIEFEMVAYDSGEHKMNYSLDYKHAKTRLASHVLNVLEPQLQISATGPNMNFVNRDGIYQIQIQNTGEVDVTNVELALAAPTGMKVTTVSRKAALDQQTGILVWNFDRLPAGSQEMIQLKALSTAAGQQVCRIAASSNETRAEQFELITDVQTRADVSIHVTNEGGPVAVGGQTQFAVKVRNNGSSLADNVDVFVELPPSLMPVATNQYSVSELDNSVRFSTTSIPAGEERELRFTAVGVAKGEHVVRGVMSISGSERRLIAEDSVFVFEAAHAKISESLKPEIRR